MTDVPFTSLQEFQACLEALPHINEAAKEAAIERNASLTKPPASLGRLEELAIWYVSWVGEPIPKMRQPQVLIFAGNHGVAAQGVSAFPSEVTAQMVSNFHQGGAAINQLARTFGARLDVHALSLETPTADFTTKAAMDEDACIDALATGWKAVAKDAGLVVVGEMGIGNTTSAAALSAALFGGDGAKWAGRGTGVNETGLAAKIRVIDSGLALHGDKTPLQILAALGGREIAAMAGAIAAARSYRIPVLLDGFICTAAAAVLEKSCPGALDHCQAGHVSAENAHHRMLKHLRKEPLLSLGMRLGEGSGGALAIGILQAALACYAGMASFAEAGVSTQK